MKPDPFITQLMARGLSSDLAQRIKARFADWKELCAASGSSLAETFGPAEAQSIQNARKRREIPRETVGRLITECELKCCLCWNIDSDSGVIIHHIRPHATNPDDRYENLVVLCLDHHDKVHTKRELTRDPFPPALLLQRKAEFIAAVAAFKDGTRVAPGREKSVGLATLLSPPLPPSHFIGRDSVAHAIMAALHSQNRRSAIVGMPAVGKTALALKVADASRESFPGGTLWVDIATAVAPIPEMLRRMIRSLGHKVTGLQIEEQLALFGSLLAKRSATVGPLLLLIDDVGELLISDLVRLASYVPPNVSLLITTREATVGAALGATQFRLEPLERKYGRDLLEAISGSALIRSEPSETDTLLSLLGDLPLAVELVARQIAVRGVKPGFTLAALCQRLARFDPEVLSFPGHRGIALSFALSFENLGENEQRAFRSFGVLASPSVYTDGVATIIGAGKEETDSILDRLVVVSLLNWGTDVGEYRLHALLHKYSEFLFDRAADAEQSCVRLRFYQHYTSIAIATARDRPEDLSAIDRILPNVSKALQLAANNEDFTTVIETMLGLSAGMSFFTSRNLEREAMPLLNAAIGAAKHLQDGQAQSVFRGHLGTAYSRLGMITEAITQFECAIELARAVDNKYDLACHLQNLGTTLLSEARDLPRAERLLHEGLTEAEASKNIDALLGCLSTLGSLHRQIGSLAEAKRLYSAALEVSRVAGNKLSEGNNLSNLGLVRKELGDVAEGETMIRMALAIAVEIGDKRGEGNRTGHLGGIIMEKAKDLPHGPRRAEAIEAAREYTAAALRIAEETGDSEKAGAWLLNLGNLAAFEGDGTDAVNRYRQALTIAENAGLGSLEAQVHFNLGSALASEGQFSQALDHFRAARGLLQSMRSPVAAKAEAYVRRLEAMLTN